MQVTARRFRLASPVTATVLAAVALTLAAATIALVSLDGQLTTTSTVEGVVVVLAFTGVGVVVARRQQRNPVGWILLLFTVLYVLGACASYYAVLDYHLGHRGLPFAAVALLLGAVWAPSFALFPVVILLFPDGRLTRCWLGVLWAYAVLVAYALSVVVAPAIAAVAGHDIRLNASGNLTNTGQLAGWFGNPPAWLIVPVLVAIVGIGLSFVARQVLSWRRASGERRQQLKWLACGAAVAVVSLVLAALLGTSVLLVGIAALPVGIGIGILKYRLYEIDRIISRTLAYTIVTGLLVGAYAGLVLLATQVLAIKSSVAVAGSTLVAAALFSPLRSQVQRAVDHRFNRTRYDADQMVMAFAARLKNAVDLDSVREDLAGVVHQALEPVHISVWVSRREGDDAVAASSPAAKPLC
jgi:MFS family permease